MRDLVISGFRSNGIRTLTKVGNTVIGCFIGTDAAGGTGVPNGMGVAVLNGNNNVFGGSNPADRNVISGNTGTSGLSIASGSNFIRGNLSAQIGMAPPRWAVQVAALPSLAATKPTTPSAEVRRPLVTLFRLRAT